MNKRAPEGLGARGRAFWRSIAAAYELSKPEAELLLETCRTLDLVEHLQAEVDAAGGKPGAAAREIRQQRVTLGRLLAQLDFPEPDAVESPSTKRARKAAQVRWAEHTTRRRVREST